MAEFSATDRHFSCTASDAWSELCQVWWSIVDVGLPMTTRWQFSMCLHRPLNVSTLSFLLFFNYICLFIYVNALVVINLLNTVLSVFRVCLCAYWLDILKSYLNQFLSIAMLNFAINYHFDYDRQSHTYTFIWHRNQLIQFNIQFLLLHSALFFAIYCY